MAKSHNIPSYSVSTGYRDGYIMFGRQEENKLPLPQFTNPELIKKNMEEELHKKEINEIENVMKKRTSGSTSTVPYTETGTSIKPKGCDTTVGMFTNLIWDGSLEIETAPFPDVFDWIFTTIDYFIESDMRLIIRTHPVEAIRGTNEDVASSIRENYNNLPENIILVDPEENINSYKLIDDLDVGIVYNSTVGLEMAYNGLPVIIGGDTHYRNLGFTYDPDSPEEYVRFLNKSNRLKSKENTKERARRYCYLLFIQKHIEFPIHSDNGSVSVQLRPVLHDEIRPANKNFDFICERIIKNKPVIRDPATPN